MNKPIELKFRPVSVFEGGTGNLVLCQEWPSPQGDAYSRVVIEMKDAEYLATRILGVARAVQGD